MFQVVFSDESIFSVGDETAQYVRRNSGKDEFNRKCVKATVKHPTHIMVWGCFCNKGTGSLYVVDGTMNQVQYKTVLETKFLPQAKRWFKKKKFIFMQDGAPCHKAKTVMKFLAEKKIKVLPWPGNSPDCNPIENLWAIVKEKLKKKKITTREQLILEVNRIWNDDVSIKKTCKKLIKSMPRRIKSVIKSKGYYTKY